MKRQIKIFCLVAFVAVALIVTPILLNFSQVENHKIGTYIIPLEKVTLDHINGIAFVNRLLHNNVRVYWLGEPIIIEVSNGSSYSLEKGSFLVPAYQKMQKFGFSSSTFLKYIQDTSQELNVTLLRVNSTIKATVFPLTKPRIAIYAGGGCTGGTLEHVHPLEEADFDLDIITQDDILDGRLADFDVLTFPGGGPYLNHLSQTEIEEVKQFVEKGGGFMGNCGGLVYGVQIGLLDVQLAENNQEIAFAPMRGPIELEAMFPQNPITFGYGKYFESIYFWGPFIERVGTDVTVVASINSPTQELKEFIPDVTLAYIYDGYSDFSFQEGLMEKYQGTPVIINGTYGMGRVILSTVHPEILPESRQIFVNSIYSMSSGKKTLKRIGEEVTFTSDINQETEMSWSQEHFSQVENLLQQLKSKTGKALSKYRPVQYTNNKLFGSTGEYLELYLSDIHSRSTRMLNDLMNLKETYTTLDKSKIILHSASGNRKNVLTYIDNLQYRIASILKQIVELNDYPVKIFQFFESDLLTKIIPQVTLLKNASLPENYRQIIELLDTEIIALNRIKDGVDYYLLRWSFQIESVSTETVFINGLIKAMTQ